MSEEIHYKKEEDEKNGCNTDDDGDYSKESLDINVADIEPSKIKKVKIEN
jgi:hypothetical protein